MAQDTVPAPLGPSFPSQWLQSRAGFQVLAVLPCWAGPTHGPAFPESCLMPWAGLGMLLLPSCWLGWNMCWLCPDGSPGELSPPPLSYSMGPTSLCGAWIMAMFIKIILIKKRKKILVGFFLTETFPRRPFLPSQSSHSQDFCPLWQYVLNSIAQKELWVRHHTLNHQNTAILLPDFKIVFLFE